MSIRGLSSRKIYYGIKRALDVSAAGVGLLLLWPNTERARLMVEDAAEPEFA